MAKKKTAKKKTAKKKVVSNIENCPFCGKNAKFITNPWGTYLQCINKKCGAVGPNPDNASEMAAIKLWNQRR